MFTNIKAFSYKSQTKSLGRGKEKSHKVDWLNLMTIVNNDDSLTMTMDIDDRCYHFSLPMQAAVFLRDRLIKQIEKVEQVNSAIIAEQLKDWNEAFDLNA